MAYSVTNPTAAGLVSSPEKWPGIITAPEDLGSRVITGKRPDFFFRPDGPMPEEVSMLIETPPCGDEWTRDKLVEVYREKVDARVAAAHEKYRGRFLGARRVLAVRASHCRRVVRRSKDAAKCSVARALGAASDAGSGGGGGGGSGGEWRRRASC